VADGEAVLYITSLTAEEPTSGDLLAFVRGTSSA
jgi:hypothetical protein